MSRRNKNRYNKKSVEESKRQSLKEITKIRERLDSLSGKTDIPEDTPAWNNLLMYSEHEISINKAKIESTTVGTKSHKAPMWSRKPRQNKSKYS